MPNLEEMSRVLFRHHWERVEDWAENINRLADLTDPEINELTRSASMPASARLAAK
jgi:hypothetical protein